VNRIRAASVRRKVNKTIKNNVEWTVADGDYVEVECKVERKRERSTRIASSGLLQLRTGQKLAE
jgi:hypothetical protein